VLTLDGARDYIYSASRTDRKPFMTQFDDRERAFETKFARDEEMQFRIIARRNRLLGEWAAKLMGLSDVESEAYAKDVVRADFEEAGDEDVIRKVLGDLTAAGVDIDEQRIREALGHKQVEARRQLIESTS
jgi:hypothetical protein